MEENGRRTPGWRVFAAPCAVAETHTLSVQASRQRQRTDYDKAEACRTDRNDGILAFASQR